MRLNRIVKTCYFCGTKMESLDTGWKKPVEVHFTTYRGYDCCLDCKKDQERKFQNHMERYHKSNGR